MNCRLVASFWELEFSLDPQDEFIDLTQVLGVQSDVEVGGPDHPQVGSIPNIRTSACSTAVLPAPFGPQPVFADSAVATVWPFLPSSHMPTPVDLGATLRDLHAITAPPPPLPAYQPLIRLREALDLVTTRDAPALTADQHAWLTDHADRLQAAYQNLTSYLGEGLIHGDAHTENHLP